MAEDSQQDGVDMLDLIDDFGGRAQVMHGAACVGLVIQDKPGLVMTPAQTRMLAAMLLRQANFAEATDATV